MPPDGTDEHRVIVGTVVQKAEAYLERSKGMAGSRTNDGSKKIGLKQKLVRGLIILPVPLTERRKSSITRCNRNTFHRQ